MDGPGKIWRDALDEGRLLLPVDAGTREAFFPPRVAAPGTGNAVDWIEASGGGVVHSVSIVHPRPPEAPYAVVLVDLDEGVRIMSGVPRIEPDKVAIGMKVVARIDRSGDEPLLLFDPA